MRRQGNGYWGVLLMKNPNNRNQFLNNNNNNMSE